MLELVWLSRDVKGATAWLEPALDRIRSMCVRFNGKPDVLAAKVWNCYAQGLPDMGLWLIVDTPPEGPNQAVGHLLVFANLWNDDYVGWVVQLEVDPPHRTPRALREQGLEELDQWAARFNAAYASKGIAVREFLMSTKRDHDAWARLFNFDDFRTIKRRPVRGST